MLSQIRRWNTNATTHHAFPNALPDLHLFGMLMCAAMTHITPLPNDGLRASARGYLCCDHRSGEGPGARTRVYAPVG
eukprot:1818147-Alexandrium_andersonii.AAC.2